MANLLKNKAKTNSDGTTNLLTSGDKVGMDVSLGLNLILASSKRDVWDDVGRLGRLRGNGSRFQTAEAHLTVGCGGLPPLPCYVLFSRMRSEGFSFNSWGSGGRALFVTRCF